VPSRTTFQNAVDLAEKLAKDVQTWLVREFFHETASGVRLLSPLSRFAKESIEQLATTWGRLSLNEATRELIFLLCGQKPLLDFVKSQTSSDDKAGAVAARVLEVSSLSRALRSLHG
jgi:ubiquinone biosynthesis protein UbiJ